MAIAAHAPGKLYARNKGLLKMSKGQLHDFAATPAREYEEAMTPTVQRSTVRSLLAVFFFVASAYCARTAGLLLFSIFGFAAFVICLIGALWE